MPVVARDRADEGDLLLGTPGADAVDAALAPVVSTLDSFSAYLDPATVPEDMLRWLASWVLVAVDDLQRPERRLEVVR